MNLFKSDVWQNIDLIFPEGGTVLDGTWYDNEDICYMNLPQISSPLIKPIRSIPLYEAEITWYDNGNMERVTTYHTYPPYMVDNIPVLNAYAQKLYNNFTNNLIIAKESSLDDFESLYSSI